MVYLLHKQSINVCAALSESQCIDRAINVYEKFKNLFYCSRAINIYENLTLDEQSSVYEMQPSVKLPRSHNDN